MLNLLDSWFKMNLGDGAFYAVFGFLFVFFGIVVLILIFTLFGFVMKKITTRPKRERKKKDKKAETETASVALPEEGNDGEISPELVAVLTAAVAAVLESENVQCDFVVRRITKLQ